MIALTRKALYLPTALQAEKSGPRRDPLGRPVGRPDDAGAAGRGARGVHALPVRRGPSGPGCSCAAGGLAQRPAEDDDIYNHRGEGRGAAPHVRGADGVSHETGPTDPAGSLRLGTLRHFIQPN